jgi:hypothetical protein
MAQSVIRVIRLPAEASREGGRFWPLSTPPKKLNFLLDTTSAFWQKKSGQVFAEGRAKQIRTIEGPEMSSPREKSNKATTMKEKLN